MLRKKIEKFNLSCFLFLFAFERDYFLLNLAFFEEARRMNYEQKPTNKAMDSLFFNKTLKQFTIFNRLIFYIYSYKLGYIILIYFK